MYNVNYGTVINRNIYTTFYTTAPNITAENVQFGKITQKIKQKVICLNISNYQPSN